MAGAALRSVLVTGASTGIGAATVRALTDQGFEVFAGFRTPEHVNALCEHCPSRIFTLPLDVTDESSIHAAVQCVQVRAAGRGLYGLVNNAGVALGGPLECTPISVLRRQLDVNVLGPAAVTQACLPLLRQATGRIVNISSISGRVALPFVGPYAASKFALRAMSDSLRAELRPWGIEVVMIEPGQIATPIWEKGIAECERVQAEWPADAHEYYDATMAALLNHVRRGGGLPPERVANEIVKAMTSKRPRTCYVVGRDSRWLRWIDRLPTRWRDALITRSLPRGR
ncbi:MAG: SDR family oxidoreductase [Planctomycetia bacterium]|nr:SDR family oxidoreductase [Planctomycetia bacterium]